MKIIQFYEQAFRTLHTNMQHGKPTPHKAFLLLAVIDMIEEGLISSTHINLTDELEARFNKHWKHLLGKSAYFSPDVFKPYYHMQHEPCSNRPHSSNSDQSSPMSSTHLRLLE